MASKSAKTICLPLRVKLVAQHANACKHLGIGFAPLMYLVILLMYDGRYCVISAIIYHLGLLDWEAQDVGDFVE